MKRYEIKDWGLVKELAKTGCYGNYSKENENCVKFAKKEKICMVCKLASSTFRGTVTLFKAKGKCWQIKKEKGD